MMNELRVKNMNSVGPRSSLPWSVTKTSHATSLPSIMLGITKL